MPLLSIQVTELVDAVFIAESIAKLKAKANSESNTPKISSFQSLSALVWRSITRARSPPCDQRTTCRLAANNRSRILWKFNSCSECRNHDKGLLEKGLGWAAWKLHQAVARVVLQSLKVWLESPFVIQIGRFFDPPLCDDGWLAQAVKEVEALLESDEEFMNAVSVSNPLY
ncbi:hypothetical protein JHK87_014232 [Glycine soja]|nr:hypothetical protein JHK87_014232 [Glycine soja]